MHAQIRGVQARRPENILDNVFVLFFIVLNLFYSLQWGSDCFITEKTILFQGPLGVQLFSGGGGGSNFFQGGGGGVQMLISIETHIA